MRFFYLVFIANIWFTQCVTAQASLSDTSYRYGVHVGMPDLYSYELLFSKKDKGYKDKWNRIGLAVQFRYRQMNDKMEDSTLSSDLRKDMLLEFVSGVERRKDMGGGFELLRGFDRKIAIFKAIDQRNGYNFGPFAYGGSFASLELKPFLGIRYHFNKQFFLSIESSVSTSLFVNVSFGEIPNNAQFQKSRGTTISFDLMPRNIIRIGSYF